MVVGVAPALSVDIVVVGAVVVVWVVVVVSVIGVIARHVPNEGWCGVGAVEAEVGCCAVVLVVAIEPDAVEVDRHEDFFAGIGVEGVDPDLVVG